MAILLSTTFANALLAHDATAAQSAVADQLGGGSLVVYSGTPPTGPNEALSGNTVLATFTFAAATAWSAPSAGVQNLDIPTATVTAAASGTATFFRILSSGAVALIQGTVGTSGQDFNLSSTTITSGDNVSITGTPSIAWTVT
jgi:hypothetical protein